MRPRHGSWRLLADEARRQREEREPLVRVEPPHETEASLEGEPATAPRAAEPLKPV
jgi:hypothetical protein